MSDLHRKTDSMVFTWLDEARGLPLTVESLSYEQRKEMTREQRNEYDVLRNRVSVKQHYPEGALIFEGNDNTHFEFIAFSREEAKELFEFLKVVFWQEEDGV